MLQYVGRRDACVTCLAPTQSSGVGLGLRTEAALKHAHKTALTSAYAEGCADGILLQDSRGEQMRKTGKPEEINVILSQVMHRDIMEG